MMKPYALAWDPKNPDRPSWCLLGINVRLEEIQGAVTGVKFFYPEEDAVTLAPYASTFGIQFIHYQGILCPHRAMAQLEQELDIYFEEKERERAKRVIRIISHVQGHTPKRIHSELRHPNRMLFRFVAVPYAGESDETIYVHENVDRDTAHREVLEALVKLGYEVTPNTPGDDGLTIVISGYTQPKRKRFWQR